VISKKFFFIDFLDELRLFIEEKPIYTKNKFPSLCCRSPKTEFVSHEIFIGREIDQKFYAELKKVHFMGCEMQPGVMRAQKREIQISWVKKIL
jgi:hypothetical protein